MKEILDGACYKYNKQTGEKEKIIHIEIKPTEYCERCGKKTFLIHTFRYWFNTGSFDYLCGECIEHYKDIERTNHPEMARYVDY